MIVRHEHAAGTGVRVRLGIAIALVTAPWFVPAGDTGHASGPNATPHVVDTPAPEAGIDATVPQSLTVSPERLQSIGVKFETAAKRQMDRQVRTVGRVLIDERRVAHVNIKFEGWIERLYADATGQMVRKGQVLFTVYSPDLVATQEEYLLAVRNAAGLGRSDYPEVANGARSLVEVAGRRLRLWDITEDHIRDLELTGQVLKTLPIHSPLSGTIIEKQAVAGIHVNPGDDLYTIADLGKIWVIADVYENELPFIEVGQTATISLSYDPSMSFEAKVGFVYPTLDPKSRTARVRFELDNPGERLKPDMFTNVVLSVPLGNRLFVPKDAVLESGERQIIFIHLGGGRLEWRTVRLGIQAGEQVEILEGLRDGEHIVTSANFLLDSEAQLKAAVGGMQGMKH